MECRIILRKAPNAFEGRNSAQVCWKQTPRFRVTLSWILYISFLNRGSAEPQGSASGCQGFRLNRLKLPGTKFATTVLLGCRNITVLQLHRVPWATQTFTEGSAATKRLKNTALHGPNSVHLHLTCIITFGLKNVHLVTDWPYFKLFVIWTNKKHTWNHILVQVIDKVLLVVPQWF